MERLNFQTKVIVATAIALTAFDLTVRGFMAQRAPVAAQTGDVITAREIRLVDQSGNLRAQFYTDENTESGLVMYDRDGVRRAQLDTFQQVPSLMLFQPDGARSSYFGIKNEGGGVLQMYDGSGTNPLTMMEAPSNNQGLTSSSLTLNCEVDCCR